MEITFSHGSGLHGVAMGMTSSRQSTPCSSTAKEEGRGLSPPDSCSTNTSTLASFSTESEDPSFPGDSVEVLVREMALSEDRWLFFEPGKNKSSSILSHVARTPPEKGQGNCVFLFNGSAVELAVESTDPYNDFRRSMEEMVESRG